MPRKENTKAKTWERDRRTRMNAYFSTLAELLPPQQDGRKRNKMDILIHATKYIKDLHSRTEELLKTNASVAHKEELARLKKLVGQLFSRMHLLSNLLKDAGITVPAEPALEKISPLKWSNKINVNTVEKFLSNYEQKKKIEKKKDNTTSSKVVESKKATVDKKSVNKDTIENQENCLNSRNDKKDEPSETVIESNSSSKESPAHDTTSNDKPVTDSEATTALKNVEKSSKPKKRKRNEAYRIIASTGAEVISSLPTGTLVFSGAKIMPMVTPMPPLASNIIMNPQSQAQNPPIILNNAQQSQMFVVQPLQSSPVQNSVISIPNQAVLSAVHDVNFNTVPNIRANMIVNPKTWASNVKTLINTTKIGGHKGILPKGRENTKTTMTYKVPIPAIHKEKHEKKMDAKEPDTKLKTVSKSVKNQRSSLGDSQTEEKKNNVSSSVNSENSKHSKKRNAILNGAENEIPEKTRKTIDSGESSTKFSVTVSSESDIPVTCKSIENLKHVVEKIGEDVKSLEEQDKQEQDKSEGQDEKEVKLLDLKDKHDAENVTVTATTTSEDLTVKETDVVQAETAVQESNDKEVEKSHEDHTEVKKTNLLDIEMIEIGRDEEKVSSEMKENVLVEEVCPAEKTVRTLTDCEREIENAVIIPDTVNDVCNLETGFDNLLHSNGTSTEIVNEAMVAENNKILLNLDTNTTTTMKLETSTTDVSTSTTTVLTPAQNTMNTNMSKTVSISKEEELKSLSYSTSNSFVPINKSEALHSDLSNDIFASLQVPSSSHNPESISPTVAFLTAFPLVSSLSGKTVVLEEEMKDDFNHSHTPPMLLQIGTIEPNSFKIKSSSTTENTDNVTKTSSSRTESKTETTTTVKAMPKIIGNEAVKESFKIVQTSTSQLAVKVPNEVVSIANEGRGIATNVVTNITNNIISSSAVTKTVINEPSAIVSIASTGYNTQNDKTPTMSNFVATSTKDISANTCRPSNTSAVVNESINKFNSVSRYSVPVTCPNVCQQDCTKNNTIRNNHYDYQVCSLDNYNSRNNGMPFENMRQDYMIRNKNTTFSGSSEGIASNCSSMNKTLQQPTRTIDQSEKIPNMHSQNLPEQTNNDFSSSKKIDANEFQRDLTYDVNEKAKNPPKDSVSNMVEPNNNNDNYHRKSAETQSSYIDAYGKGGKKIVVSSSASNDKNVSIRNSYSQQQDSFIITSNYEESVTSRQSTTTIAHNTSNFSILSWTTFSPANGGNSNLVQFDQGSSQADLTQSKTICENFNYLPLHKESTIPAHSYAPEASASSFDKPRTKQTIDTQKRPFNDPSKSRNLRPIAPPQKHNRSQTQNQVPSSEYNKYNSENKNKIKYPVEMDYIHNDFLSVDPRQQQPHQQQKSTSQSIQPVKQDNKSNYMISDYDPQTNFDSEQNNAGRYNSDVYVSSNFKYVDKQQQLSQKYQSPVQSQTQILQQQGQQQQQQTSNNKQKTQSQQVQQQQQHSVRPPVNWMMTPEIKHNTTNIGDIILPPIGKELDFCQNNFFSQTPTYNQSTPNQFYNNYDVAAHGFPNISMLQSDPKRGMDPTFYTEEQAFAWSPTKNMTQNIEQNQTLKAIDQHVVPSTLPTLVGDLALGTNLSDKQNFLFSQMTSVRPNGNELSKDPSKEKDTSREYQMLNSQNSTQGMSFLSVSQLVEHEKAEKHQQQNQHHHHHHHQQQQQQHHHHHHHQHQQQQQPQQQQQQQQPQQQPRKHQRKSNTSPRGNNKKQMDIRKQAVNHHDEQKNTGSGFSDQSYQQNDIHWRNRNCKSNYTAEALIGTVSSANDSTHQDKNTTKYNYPQNKFPSSLHSSEAMMPINYFPNVDNTSGYGQVVNQNFNHSYTYSSNTNIYPTTNFITSISNTPTNYMMSLHENSDYLETGNFLLPPNAATTTIPSSSLTNMSANKGHQHFMPSKHHQSCDKRSYTTVQKKSKRKGDSSVQNFEFPLSGITSPLDDYHHTTTFLSPHTNPLYQNHSQTNVYPKPMNTLPPPPPSTIPVPPPSQGLPISAPSSGISAGNPMVMAHHPSGTSLTNFNLSTIFPEMNDKVAGYKSSSNGIPSGPVQSSSHVSTSYPQRVSYTNSLGHMPQVSETSHFSSDLPRPPPTDLVHYKNP